MGAEGRRRPRLAARQPTALWPGASACRCRLFSVLLKVYNPGTRTFLGWNHLLLARSLVVSMVAARSSASLQPAPELRMFWGF